MCDNTDSRSFNIVFFSVDALGHINPILSIADELAKREHNVTILTVRPISQAQSITNGRAFKIDSCESSPQEALSDAAMRAIMEPLISNFRKGPIEAFKATYNLEGAVGKHLEDVIDKHDAIEAKLRSLKPDLIVCDHIIGVPCATFVAKRWIRVYSGFPSCIFSSQNDNYVAGLGLSPNEATKDWKKFELKTKQTIREKLRKFWLEKGAIDWPGNIELVPVSPYLNFYLGPEELGLEKVPNLKPLPDIWFRLEHTIHGPIGQSDFELPESLRKVPGKLIYFSLGTLVTSDITLINRLLQILSKSSNKFVISKGQMHQYIKLYPNMWGEKFIDQKAVLSQADLFITHGGHNSIIEAFYYGVPGLIVLPVFADQFDSAQRIQDCGLGARLDPFNCTESELLGTIDSLLTNEKPKEQMKSISSRLKSIKYHHIAANKIEDLLRN